MRPKTQTFNAMDIPADVQMPLATLMISIIQKGDIAISERELLEKLRSAGYPETYISGALQHARVNAKQ